MGKPVIVLGDKTDHGGTVVEGDPIAVIEGKPIARVGDKVSCPKCKGTFPIVEGVSNFLFNKPVALHGHQTACGAKLISSQTIFTVSDSSGSAAAATAAAKGASRDQALSDDGSVASADDTAQGNQSQSKQLYDERAQLVSPVIPGLPYFIETDDGREFAGRADEQGLLPRITTTDEAYYRVYWGDEALAKHAGLEA